MLNTMRKISDNFIIKAVFVLIIVSFVVWGIGDNFNSKRNILVTIGNEFIGREEFLAAKKHKIDELQSRLGVSLTEEQIKSFQIDQVVLSQLVDHKLIELETKELGLKVSDQTVLEHIKQIPSFQNDNGGFDTELFKKILSLNGMSEGDYVDLTNKEIASSNLLGSLMSVKIAPDILVEYIWKYQLQNRIVELVKIDDQSVQPIANPANDLLEKYYIENKHKYFAPERRDITYLELKNSALLSKITVSDAELDLEYESNLADYYSEEKRDIYNLFFKDKDQASLALKKLQNSSDLLITIREVSNLNPKELVLENVSKNSLPEELRSASFSLEKDKISEVIKSPLGFHIIAIGNIYPASAKSFVEVKEIIKKTLSERKLEQLIYETTKQFEDELAGGASLEEIASKFQLSIHRAKAIDAKGEDENGKLNSALPNDANFLATVFSTAEKENSALTVEDDNEGYFIVQIDKINLTEQMDFATAYKKLLVDYKKSKLNEAKKQLAEELLKKVKAGEKIDALAKTNKLTYLADVNISRVNQVEDEHKLPTGLINELFASKLGETTSVVQDNDHNYFFGIVKDIKKQEQILGKDEAAKIKDALTRQAGHEIYEQYLVYLRKKYRVIQVSPNEANDDV